MEKLKKLTVSFTLMLALSVAAMAGETGSPPCNPGQTETPPCAAPVTDNSTTPGEILNVSGQTSTPPASDTVDLVDLGQVVLWALSLF
jgi:hypothetical protein